MELVNCPRCKKVFTRMSDPLCEACMKEEEQSYEKVRAFLKENPDSQLAEVARETGVSEKRILKYVRDGRLEATGTFGGVTCDKCGKPIKYGRYCEKCVIAINNSVQEAFNKPVYSGPKMHTAQHKK